MRVHLSLGSNLEAERCLASAVARLASVGRVLALSRVYESAPLDGASGGNFLNAAALVETPLSAERLRERLRMIESGLGRVRPAPRRAPRTIDIDLIYAPGAQPHRDARRHPHVATPLAEIDPDFQNPETGETLRRIALRVGRSGLRVREDVRIG